MSTFEPEDSTLAVSRGVGMPIHKRGKRVTNAEVKEVEDLLGRGKTVTAIVRETGVSRSKVYQLRSNEQAIQRREEADRKRPCVQHVFIREIIKDDSPKTVATSRTEKMIEVKQCRLCGFEERRSRFLQIN
jgi:hypothetical protein